MALIKGEKWYHKRLDAYMERNYSRHKDDIVWFCDPWINEYLFEIPETGLLVNLFCDDDGIVREQIYHRK